MEVLVKGNKELAEERIGICEWCGTVIEAHESEVNQFSCMGCPTCNKSIAMQLRFSEKGIMIQNM